MFLIPRPQSAVLLLRERAALFTSGFLKQGFPVWEARADSRGEVGLGVWVVLFVCVWEIRPEPEETQNSGGKYLVSKKMMVMSLET